MVRDAVPAGVLEWAEEREALRRAGEFAAADAIRERIRLAGYTVQDTASGPVVQAAPEYLTSRPADVPDRTDAPDGPDLSVLLLLDAPPAGDQPPWVVEDAARCLAGVLRATAGHRAEVCILDNGVGGDAGTWAADAGGGVGIESVHLDEPVGFGEARALQHRMATGRLLVWLDTGVELARGAASALIDAFAASDVGAVGRWGGDLRGSVRRFEPADTPASGEPPRDVHAVWGYLLALRRDLIRTGAVCVDPAFAFYRHADADVSFQVRAAGARTVLAPLPATQHLHRGWSAAPADEVERLSSGNYRRLLERWRPEMERLAASG
jgi:GT2 family glycosyltransferase